MIIEMSLSIVDHLGALSDIHTNGLSNHIKLERFQWRERDVDVAPNPRPKACRPWPNKKHIGFKRIGYFMMWGVEVSDDTRLFTVETTWIVRGIEISRVNEFILPEDAREKRIEISLYHSINPGGGEKQRLDCWPADEERTREDRGKRGFVLVRT